MKNDYLKWGALLFALVATASAEYELARQVGFNQWVAAAVPGALDIYTVRAMRAHRDVLVAVSAMIGVNAASHLVTAGLLPVNVPLVVAVSAIAPLVLWRVHRLANKHETPVEPNLLDVIQEVPDATVERVPEAYPVLETAVPAVPEAVPAGVRLLPIVARPETVETVGVVASEPPRTRSEVHAEYVPEPVPDWTVSGEYADKDGNPTEPDPTDDGYGDPLSEYGLGLAAEAFKEQLIEGDVPSIRAIKTQLGVGQPRAKEIQDGLRQVLLRQAVRS
ncbi:hypothetical protein FNV64_45305 [Streptomyces sp. S1A1-7]|uniref:hypothetical protein n=1 Tax=Streptomyces sp. S1A1-7 TaxID=2594459 RepID=UPI001162256E|nr:hypothetical protein [Streptomyces sp. S1A1-7]QDN81813.1 hypothetical protein FNV64_45305 [Streptomyces sp. S1A1-7]